MLLVARAEAALSAQLDVTAELRSQLRAMQERVEAAETQCAAMREALDNVCEFLNCPEECMAEKCPGDAGSLEKLFRVANSDDAGVKMLKERERLQEFVATMRERRGCHRSRVTYSTTDDMCFFCDTAVICRALVVLDTKGVLEE